jgi:hypothetical protein
MEEKRVLLYLGSERDPKMIYGFPSLRGEEHNIFESVRSRLRVRKLFCY